MMGSVWYAELYSDAWYYLPRKVKQVSIEKFLGDHGYALGDFKWETRKVKAAKIPPWESVGKGDHELVYFMEAIGSNRIKIGITDSLHSRLTLVKTYSPFPVVIIGCMYGYRELEDEIHHKFRHIRKNGEWFEGTQELRNYIDHVTDGEVFPMLHSPSKGGDAVPTKQ